MKKKLYAACAALFLIIVFMTGVVFAWFLRGGTLGGIFFSIAKIDSEITLYKADDFNYNGVPDKNEQGHYSFELIGTKFAQSSQSETSEKFEINIGDFMPTQIVTYRIEVYNKSETSNTLRFAFENENGTGLDSNAQLLSARLLQAEIEIESKNPLSYYEKNISLNDKWFFSDYFAQGADISNNELPLGINGDGGITTRTVIQQREVMVYWLQLEFEIFDVLSQRQGFNLTKAQYQAAQNAEIKLPQLKVYLEIYR